MLANQRRQKIFELLREDGSAKVAHLARIFKVTVVTIRQDLEKLEQQRLVIRGHGIKYPGIDPKHLELFRENDVEVIIA